MDMKTFKDVLVLNMDSTPDETGDFFDENSVIKFPSSVPVLGPAGESPIGIASLRTVNNRLLADITLPMSLPEDLTPAVCGRYLARFGKRVDGAEITFVTLSPYNTDRRIPTLGFYSVSGK